MSEFHTLDRIFLILDILCNTRKQERYPAYLFNMCIEGQNWLQDSSQEAKVMRFRASIWLDTLFLGSSPFFLSLFHKEIFTLCFRVFTLLVEENCKHTIKYYTSKERCAGHGSWNRSCFWFTSIFPLLSSPVINRKAVKPNITSHVSFLLTIAT